MITRSLNAWDRLPYEPMIWYSRFQRYLHLGFNRSFAAVHRAEMDEQTKAKKKHREAHDGAWRNAFEKFRWQERAAAWDEAELERRQREYRDRIKQVEDWAWAATKAIYEKLMAMLAFPIAETITRKADDGTTIVVKPAAWSFRDAATLAAIIVQLGRAAAGQDESGGGQVAVNVNAASAGVTVHAPRTPPEMMRWLREFTGIAPPKEIAN